LIEWQQSARIQSSYGTLNFNDDSGTTLYLLDPQRCVARRNLRVTADPVPQGDGEILHARFADGVEFDITLTLWTDRNSPACDDDARLMEEALHKHLQAILNGSGRWFWQPTGYGDERMMDEARWLAPLVSTMGNEGIWELTFSIDSPFPYIIDATQTTESLSNAIADTLTNTGNAPFWPVIRVLGPASAFTIENQDNGMMIDYDPTLPGGQNISVGDYAEIDTFRNTIYLNGDEDNLKAGIAVTNTDFWSLSPGTTNVIITGADANFLLNDAWLP
jgi:hypothetical protein